MNEATPRTRSAKLGGRRLLRPARWLAAGLAALLALSLAPVPAFADETDGDVTIGVDKTVAGANGTVPTFEPGDSVTYEIELECSSLTSGICLGARLTDTIPAPLVLQSVSVQPPGISSNNSVIASNIVDISFTQSNELGEGMLPGEADIAVTVLIPADITWEQAQALGQIDNTASFSAAGLTDSSTAGILIDVPVVLAADATKSADDNMGGSGRPIPAVPGQPVDFTIGGANTSNRPVDSITVTDPAAGSSNMEYLDITSIGPVTPPAGADQFMFVYTDDTGTHEVGPYPAPTDSVPLDGIDPTTITSVSFVFSNSTGAQLPPQTGLGDYASIGIATQTNDLVSGLDPDESIVIDNVVEATVEVDGDTASDTANASVTVENTPPGVTVAKSYLQNTLLPGESTTANVRADNGGKDVTSMTIADPGEGGADFAEQGLVFNGFDEDAIEWPEAADHVSITYTYADGSVETLESERTDPESIPASTHPEDVVGFSITFTGPIDAGAYAAIPYGVTALPVTGEDDVVTTNTVDAEVTDSDGATADDSASADMTRQPTRVYTDVEKNIVKDQIYSVPGATTIVELTASVRPDSTTGAEYLVVQDPDTDGLSDFWNYFDLTSIGPVDVPQNASMTVEVLTYPDGTTWETLDVDPMPVPPGTTWSYTVPDEDKDSIAGIRFTFTPVPEGSLLQPNFNVLTYFNVELRDDLRDGSGPAAGGSEDPITIDNDAMSEVDNDDTGQGPQTDTDDDSIDILPIDGGDGEGPDLVSKSWTPDSVLALSGAPTAATLSWGTWGIPMDTMTITDPGGTLGNTPALIAQTVFDAFDLLSIDAIDASTDPVMLFDQVYAQRLSEETGEWVYLLNGFTAATPSVGAYPQYTLSDEERADTIGIRFVFSERPDRADVITNIATDPAVGSGVAETDGQDRDITIRLGLRDYLRSVPTQPVLGTTHDYTYNTDSNGVVLNTVDALGVRGDEEYEDSGQDDITILDQPMNVTLEKRFVDYDESASDPYTESEDLQEIPLPPETTSQLDFPGVTALLRARNESNTRVGTLAVTDPDPAEPDTISDQFTLYRIVSITVPEGADPALSRVFLSPAVDGQTEFTIAEAQALTPAQLWTVTSFEVVHSGALADNGTFETLIAAGAFTDIRLEFGLRKYLLSDPTTLTTTTDGTPLYNHAITTQTRPGADENGPTTETITDTATDTLTIAEPTYGVETTKTITPETRSETEPREGYQISLTGRPSGNVRSTLMTLSDATPTFWNAFQFASFQDIVLPSPIEELRVDVLTGVDYVPGLLPNSMLQLCGGSLVLEECWAEGEWITTTSGGTITAAQIAASVNADPTTVQGVRFSYRTVGGEHWERPANPTVSASFVADRRELLVFDGTDDGVDTEVPSTRPGLAPAPGETEAGVFTDSVFTVAVGSWEGFEGQPYTADAASTDTTTLTHVENGVSILKVHGREAAPVNQNTFYPGEDIPYAITVVNTGGWPITGLTLTDQVETDADGPMLVEPERDPGDDTPVYTATLNGVPVDPFSGSMDPVTGLIAFTFPDDFVLAPGDTLVVSAGLEFRQTPTPVQPGTDVTNGATVTSDRFFDTCDFATQAQPQPTTEDVEVCSSSTDASPAPFSPIATDKSVRGVGAGVEGAVPGDANYDDLGVVGLLVSDPAEYCAAPNAGGLYYRTPCVPITRPGGVEQWRLELTNRGNIPVSTVATIDVLPYPGDTGVIISGDRGSRWQPIFLGEVVSTTQPLPGSTLEVWYSTEVPNAACNEADILNETGGIADDDPCKDEVDNDRPDMWQLYSDDLDEDVLAQVRALKIVASFAEGGELPPNGTVNMTFLTQTPWYSELTALPQNGVDPIAWNSGASGSAGVYTVQDQSTYVQSQVIEPRRVGVALATGQIQLEKDVEGFDDAWGELPDEYSLTVACTSGPGPDNGVPLDGPNGEDLSVVRLASDGTPLVYNGGTGEWGTVTLPLYAQCTVSEIEDAAAQGSIVTYDPPGADETTSGEIEALRFGFADNIANPAETGDPSEATISILNTYVPGGFTVTKAIDNGGAVDQDDNPISYDEREFSFTATCTFLGATVLDEEFTLSPGDVDSVTFGDLPAGAECTVTETDAAGAAGTTIVVTEDGAAGPEEETSEASFVVLPYDEGTTTALTVVGVENSYTVGSVSVVKTIVDPGGWGTADFTVEMSCTLDGVTPNPVFEGSATLSAADPTWTVDNLPTGAVCVVTETENGGANSSTPSVTVVVGDDATVPVEADITNTFTIGSLQVVKELEGAPANALDPATTYEYEVSLSCTRVVNDETVDVAIPLGPTRVVTVDSPALYEGLPTGALCTVTETDAGHATDHTISPDQPVEIGAGQTPVVVTVSNVFENGAVSVEKTIDAPEGFPVPAEFTATVSCTWQGAEVPLVDDGVVTIVPGAEPVVIPDVPVGSICTVAEDDFGQTGTTVSPESITVTEADQTFAFEIENTYELATLQVGKIVESASEFVPTQFEFHVVCTFQGETVVDETFWLDANETETITGIPARSECTITETDDRDADGTVTAADVPGVDGDLAPQIDQETRTVVIPELQPDSTAVVNTVTYTNLFDSTALVLVKEFEGAGADQFGLDQTFTFTILCTFGGETVIDAQVVLNAENGWSTAVHEVVAGSECTVTEDDLNGADAVVIEPNDGENTSVGTGIVPEGGGLVTVTATNWYLTGSLEVTKTFAGDGAEKFGTDDFELELSCLRDGVEIVIPDGDVRIVSAESPTALWENLPTGSECTLTETDAGGANSTVILDDEGNEVAGDGDGYTFTVETDPTILSVDDQPQPGLTVQNTFNLAQLSVTKIVDSDGLDANGDPVVYGPFEVTLTCLWNGQFVQAAEPMTQTIADGETVTWTELPEEARCIVTESDAAGASGTTAVITQGGAVEPSRLGRVIPLEPLPNVDDEDQTSVEITNTFDVTSLTISKIVDGTDAASVTRTFPVAVECVLIDPSHPEPGLVVVDETYEIGGPQNLTVRIDDIPAGSICTVTETDTGDADATTMTVDGVEQPGASGTVTLTAGSVGIVFTNTFIAPLPPTGSDATPLLVAGGIAALLILAGVIVMVVMRRRRTTV